MTALQDFRDGFHDGYRRDRRQRNRGGQYIRSYRQGVAARDRQDNGGEDTTVARATRR